MSARELHAELLVLEMFDSIRQSRGHDYGCGQRGAELIRRRRELEVADPAGYVRRGAAITRTELADAFERVGRRRLERLERDNYGTASSRASLSAWRTVAKLYGRQPENSSQGLSAAPEPASEPSDGPQPAGIGSGPPMASTEKTVDGRYRSTCSSCGYSTERSKRESVEHALSQHLAYSHEVSS